MLFFKYTGAGNDFILIDNRNHFFSKDLVVKLCHRQQGIGADGVILLDSFEKERFKMSIYNADGSSAEMCGNGIRCFTKFLFDLGYKRDRYFIENIEGKLYSTSIQKDGHVEVQMADASDLMFNKLCRVGKETLSLHFLNTGVPHVVCFVSDVDTVDVLSLGRLIRNHKNFQPKGTNVNFAMINFDHTLKIRTYERGVENETLACGTGACAAAIAASKLFRLKSPIEVKVASKASLFVHFQQNEETFSHLTLQGPAKKVFEGSFFIHE